MAGNIIGIYQRSAGAFEHQPILVGPFSEPVSQ